MRTGRLPSPQDADVYRLTVDTPDHLRITVTPPADGSINMRLESGSLRVADIRGDPGTAVVSDVLLQPGDYDLWLIPGAASQGKYALSVEREDPFLLATDQEPNNDFTPSRPAARVAAYRGRLPHEWRPGLVHAGQPARMAATSWSGPRARTCASGSPTA